MKHIVFVEATVSEIMYMVFVRVPAELRCAMMEGELKPMVARCIRPLVHALRRARPGTYQAVLDDLKVDLRGATDVAAVERAFNVKVSFAVAVVVSVAVGCSCGCGCGWLQLQWQWQWQAVAVVKVAALVLWSCLRS